MNLTRCVLHLIVAFTFRHGFPHSPTALAYDPIQKLLVIGDKSGSLRILGRPGVDLHFRHEGDSACAVIQIEFLVNEGALVTATADDSLHLWNFRQKFPQVVQSLKFQRERITCLHLPVGSKWLYVGTEKGNIHVVNIESFALSGYIINWNKAIEVIRTTHPGAVIGLCDNPLDANKLLIAYESGQIVLWDMRGKCAEMRWQSAEPLRSVAWHHEGKHFVSSHTDGSLCTWPLRPIPKPQLHSFPHAKINKDGKLEACKPIHKVDLRTSRMGETFTIFSGGLSMEKGGKSPCITVLTSKSTTVLEMEHPVVDFITVCESPWSSDMQEPYAIAVLLQNDLVLIDLLTSGFPCFESPYPMDLHESPVTCCTYLVDCPSDLVPAFYSVGRSSASRKTGFSDREWPVSGGEWSPASCSYSEIVITGHQDGSVKFWDASAGTLQILYKLKTGKIFERPRARSVDSSDDDPLSIQLISLCADTRRLCIAGSSGHVILFKFKKTESSAEILVLEIPISYESFEDGDGSPECEFIPRSAPKPPDALENERKNDGMLKVRPGPQRKPPGFQAQLVCLTPWTTGSHPGQITSLCINSSYGLMAYGNEYGLAVVDIVQKVCLLNVASPDLYGAQDPYSRVPKSPKRSDNNKDEQTRSPSIDQLSDNPLSTSPQKTPIMMPSTSSSISTLQQQQQQPIVEPIITATEATPVSESDITPILSTSPVTRPISPASEALENLNSPTDTITNLTDDSSASAKPFETVGEVRRKSSSSWKTFNLKHQFSKVKMPTTKPNTSSSSSSTVDNNQPKHGSIFYYGTIEGTPLSPVEISPDSPLNETSGDSTATDTEQDKSDYIEQLEKDIVTSLNELDNKEIQSSENICIESIIEPIVSSSDDLSDTENQSSSPPLNSIQNIAQSVPKSGLLQNEQKMNRIRGGKKERTMSQPQAVPCKRVDFIEEPIIAKSLITNVEGGKLSRPSDLPLFNTTSGNNGNNGGNGDDRQPIPPPRFKKKDKRDQRLLSVPNIKYHVRDLRSRNAKSDQNTSSFAGNLMRRLKNICVKGDRQPKATKIKKLFRSNFQSQMNGVCGGGGNSGNIGGGTTSSGTTSGGVYSGSNTAIGTTVVNPNNRRMVIMGSGGSNSSGIGGSSGGYQILSNINNNINNNNNNSNICGNIGSGNLYNVCILNSAGIKTQQLSSTPSTALTGSTILQSSNCGGINNSIIQSNILQSGSSNSGIQSSSNITNLQYQTLSQTQQQQQQLPLPQQHGNVLDSVRRSRSQGGKKLQKCLSTASYGEDMSISRPQMAPLTHNLLMTRQYCSFDKLDSSFSRSRSSSMSSLENITSEAVTCLSFADSYTKKTDPTILVPTLWVGTSLGSVLTVSISLPDSDCRTAQPVLVSILGGPIFRLKGSILAMSFLDCNGSLIVNSSEPWKDEVKRDRTPTKNPNRMSPTLGAGVAASTSASGSSGNDSYGDRQFIVIASEKQARVVALPSQNCVYRTQITESDFVVKAEIISLRESVCLIAYLSNGHLMAYSLPSLRPLLDVDFLPLIDLSFQTKCKQGIVDPMLSIWGQQLIVHEDTNQISKTFCFSNRGHGLYLATPTEIQKFTLCSEFSQFVNEMICELFTPHEMPEQPKESFFKGLFGGGIRSLDREELFGEQSGKANRSVAKHIPGPSLEQLGQRASTATSEISRAHQLAMERGDKLNLLEERAERMSNSAENFSGTAHQMMLKYKDKKWYQL